VRARTRARLAGAALTLMGVVVGWMLADLVRWIWL
jgi:hypothetical protein